MKKRIKYIIGTILGIIIYYLNYHHAKIKPGQILSLYFHNPNPKLFEQCIRFLIKKGYHFISVSELEDILTKNLPIDKQYVVISFDDGWKENLLLLPILEKYKVKACFFISVEPVLSGNFWWEYGAFVSKFSHLNYSRMYDLKKIKNQERLKVIHEINSKISLTRSAMTKEELMEFAKSELITIGSHTLSHPITIQCTEDELKREYTESKAILESWLNKPVRYFSYPNGDYNKRDFEFIDKSGYKLAFTTHPKFIDKQTDLKQIPRCVLNDFGSFYENRSKIFGLWQKWSL